MQADIHAVKPPLYTRISCRKLERILLQLWKNMLFFRTERKHWTAVVCKVGRRHRSSAFSYSPLLYALGGGKLL